MPLGDGYGQLLRPGGVTPLPSGVQSAPDPMPEALANLGQAIERRVKPVLIERAAQAGEREGNAGTPQSRMILTDMDAAYVSAARQAYLARTATDRDDVLDRLFVEHQADPEAFEAAARQAQQEAVQGAAPDFAIDLELGWERGIQRRGQRLAIAKRDLDSRRARDDVDARVATLQGTLEAAARGGTLGEADAQEAMAEYNRLIDEKVANPIWGYTAAEAQRDRAVFAGRLASLEIGRSVVTEFETNITGGMTTRQAESVARANLAKAFEENPALAGLPEAERTRLLGVADNALKERLEVLSAERRAEEEAEREAKAQERERHQTNFGNLLLGADSGELSEADINAALARGDISPVQADTLRGNTRAAASRARTEENRAIADRRRAEADARRADAEANREERENRRDAREGQRERAQDRVFELEDMAETDPDGAERAALRDYQNGVITERQYRSIRNRARGERNSDDGARLDGTRSRMRQSRARPEELNTMESRYRDYLDRNPNATAEQRDRWHSAFLSDWERRRGQGAAPRGAVRSLAQIDADINAVRNNRSLTPADRARRLNALQQERRAAQQRAGR